MAILLGVDTGGTYTDAVLIRDDKDVIASAKSLTTRQDLAIGIGKAVDAVLTSSGVNPSDIAMASLSTTLATNALVEGQGGRVGLVYIGFREADLESHGLRQALGGDPVIVLPGGHNHAGNEAAPLDTDALHEWLSQHSGISGFAVAAQFATRNPAHELAAAEIIRNTTDSAVSCSHQLSAKLNGPKRALTALLNARLIGMIDRLIGRAQDQLKEMGITAPLMVVRGDGALISAEMARERPIETILSGPAASIVGARWMTGADIAMVSDIGGTTTDVAVLRNGRPTIDPLGAQVGPYRTMVEAVAMRTTGLGGDSEVHFQGEGLLGGVTLGPRRVLPISLVATEDPQTVHAALDSQLLSTLPGEHDGRFVRRVAGFKADGMSDRDQAFFERIAEGVRPLAEVIKSRIDLQSLQRLVSRGIVQVAAITPSDASHVLGKATAWDKTAAEKAMILFGRRRTGAGDRLSTDPSQMAQIIIDQLTHQTALALLEAAFAEEDSEFQNGPAELARHELMQRGLFQHKGLLRINTGLNVQVIGLGASAPTYYPAVGERLGCDMVLPEHAGVANAIGAVVGQITMRKSGTVTSPAEGRYRVHLTNGPQDFGSSDQAMEFLETTLRHEAQTDAVASGAADITYSVTRDIRRADVEARDMFVEATITVEASGRPRIAEEV